MNWKALGLLLTGIVLVLAPIWIFCWIANDSGNAWYGFPLAMTCGVGVCIGAAFIGFGITEFVD